MNKQLLFFITFISFFTAAVGQSKDCEKTCVVNKTVHEGAFLGVQFGTPCERETEKGIIILSVVPNTAAAKNDIKAYDVVIAINNTEVNTSGDATKLIKAQQPFDVVNFTLLRRGKTITKEVTLGAETTKIVQEKVCCDAAYSTLNDSNISVYPSPAVNNLNVAFKSVLQGEYTFGIYMANGALVREYTKKLDTSNLSEMIPVSKYDDGVYVLRITSQKTTYSKLFVVSRK